MAPLPEVEAFPGIPSFPTDVPTAPLISLSLLKLFSHDPSEEARLFTIAKDTGFFYLDYRDASEALSIQKFVDALFNLAPQVFAAPAEEKKTWNLSTTDPLWNYKPPGVLQTDQRGSRDFTEFLNVTKNGLFSQERLSRSTALHKNIGTLQSFVKTCHAIGHLILNSLNTSLDLPPGTLVNMHNLFAPSNDQVRFTRAVSSGKPLSDKEIALNEHTDVGSISVLFNRVGGLQILPPGSTEWCYVPPRPGHAVCNLGDAMVRWTNKLLNSCTHRVVTPPGQQATLERYSLVYFMRPDSAARLKRLESRSGVIPALSEGQMDEDLDVKEWSRRRFDEIRAGQGLLEKKRLKVQGY